MVFRRRLIFWLIKAYIKKWGKVIFFSFLGGLGIFFILVSSSSYFLRMLPFDKKESIGIVGAYRINNLPSLVSQKLSHGLTRIEKDGSIKPDIASSWEIKDNGKTYVFHLRPDVRFSDGRLLTAKQVTYDFKDVKIEYPDKQTIIFRLKDMYAPFLITVARPIFQRGLNGLGDFRITDLKLNGNYVQSMRLTNIKNRFYSETYYFYPSEEAVKYAFALGEITKAVGLTDYRVKNTSIDSFPNVTIEKKVNDTKLVALFYNTRDKVLSDDKIRKSLSYALPDEFKEGRRTYHSYSPTSLYYIPNRYDKRLDREHAKLLLQAGDSKTTIPALTIQTLPKYRSVAEQIVQEWKKVQVTAKIQEVDTKPDTFQVYLGDFSIPKDPDQYVLWHSTHENNITRLDNKRIDKLLEDGRRTVDMNERRKIYEDFQKYLSDATPATFLYLPYEYDISRN